MSCGHSLGQAWAHVSGGDASRCKWLWGRYMDDVVKLVVSRIVSGWTRFQDELCVWLDTLPIAVIPVESIVIPSAARNRDRPDRGTSEHEAIER